MTYEFSETDGALIKRVGFRLSTQGIILIVAGLAGIIYSFVYFSNSENLVILIYMIQSIVEIIIGVSLLFVPSYFTRVAETKGKAIGELMGGLDNMSTAFKIVWISLSINLLLDVTLIIALGG